MTEVVKSRRQSPKYLKNEIMKKVKTHPIDAIFDEIEDPIIDNFSTIGYLESLILNSTFTHFEINEMLEKINNLRESEIGPLIVKLKSNQNIRDPKDQYLEMAKSGMFSDFRDQN